MKFLKERVFSRESGIRHLVSLLLGMLVVVWTYSIMSLITGDSSWLSGVFREARRDEMLEQFLPAGIGVGIGTCVYAGLIIYRSAVKWMLRLFLKAGYSFLDAIPLVNLIAPLVYRHHWKKTGSATDFGTGLGASLQRTVHELLITDNAIFHPDGKLKYGIIRFVFVAVFRLIRCVFCLLGALIVPVLSPILPMLGILILLPVAEWNMEVASWAGIISSGLTGLIFVIHPVIALLLNPRKAKKAAPAPEANGMPMLDSEPEPYSPDPEPVELPEPDSEPAYRLPEPDPEPEELPREDPEVPAYAPQEDDGDDDAQVQERKEIVEVTERNEDREITNRKEKDI